MSDAGDCPHPPIPRSSSTWHVSWVHGHAHQHQHMKRFSHFVISFLFFFIFQLAHVRQLNEQPIKDIGLAWHVEYSGSIERNYGT